MRPQRKRGLTEHLGKLEGGAQFREALLGVSAIGQRGAQNDARGGFLLAGSRGSRCLECLLGRRLPDGWVLVHRPHRKTRELNQDDCAGHAWAIRRHQRSRMLQRLADVVLASQILEGDRFTRQQQRRALTGLGFVELAERFVIQGERLLDISRRVGGTGRHAQYLNDIDAAALGRVGYAGPQLECALEVTQRLRRRVCRCQLGRLGAGHECLRGVVGRVPMNRQRRGSQRGRAAQRTIGGYRLGVGGVCTHALTRHRVGVDRVAGERVAEPVPVISCVGRQQLMFDDLGERRVEARLVEARDRREQAVGHRSPRRRRDSEQPEPRFGQPLGPGEQDVAQGDRELLRAGARLYRGEDLLDQESVALGALIQRLEHRAWGRAAHDRLQLAGRLLPGEARKLQPPHRPYPLPCRDQGPERMRPVYLVRTEREHEQHAHAAQAPHEQRDEVQRGAIRPLQVLDHEHQRPVGGQALDHPEHQLEQARAARLAGRAGRAGRLWVELGEQASQVRPRRTEEAVELAGVHHAHERAQRVDQRAERHPLASELDAAADQHPRSALAGPLGRLLDEPRLADAGLAADQHHRRLAGDG